MSFRPEGRLTDLDSALKYTLNTLKRRSVIFLLSDFISKGFEKSLAVTARKHDLIAIRLFDPYESAYNLPFLLSLKDPELDSEILLDPSDYQNARTLKEYFIKEKVELENLFKRNDIDYLDIDISQDYIRPLVRFFNMRQRRYRR
jgi:hypothetical protein